MMMRMMIAMKSEQNPSAIDRGLNDFEMALGVLFRDSGDEQGLTIARMCGSMGFYRHDNRSIVGIHTIDRW